MTINFPFGFNITSSDPIDSRLVMTRAEMKKAGVRMPDHYLAICTDGPDAGKVFIYSSINPADDTYGRFRQLSFDDLAGSPDVPVRLSDLAEDSTSRHVSTADMARWDTKMDAIPEGTYVRPSELARVATTGSYNDLSDRPLIPGIPDIQRGDAAGNGNVVTDITASGHTVSAIRGVTAVLEGDARLTDARAPLAHTHSVSEIQVTDANQFISSAEKAKLSNIPAGAQENVIESVKVNGTVQPITGKTVDITVSSPTKLSQLENDTRFVTVSVDNLINYYNKSAIDEKLSGAMQYKTALRDPTTGLPNVENPEERTIYLVDAGSKKKDRNVKNEYLWILKDDGTHDWELIGSTTMKLDIVQDPEGISINGEALQTAMPGRVGLMTKEMASKLADIADGANVNVNADWNATSGDALILNKPTIPTSLGDLTSDEYHMTVSQAQIDAWSATESETQADWGVMDPSSAAYIRNKPTIPTELAQLATDSENQRISATEKAKLDAIPDDAEANVLESVSVDGTPLIVTDKGVDIPLTATVQAMLAQYDPKIQSIAVWSEGTAYSENSTVLRETELYVSLIDDNTGDPAEDTANWKRLSGSGGGGGSAGVTAFIYQFGNDADTEYLIPHQFMTYDFLYSIRTTDERRKYVQADVYAYDRNRAKVVLDRAPGVNALQINMVKAETVAPTPSSGVRVITISEPSTEWDVTNEFAYPAFIQTYTWDSTEEYYDEMTGDVIQPPATAFTPVSVTFHMPVSGFVVMAPSSHQEEFTDSDTWIINHGENVYYAVQVYDAEEGMIMGDVSQANGTITISFGRPRSGWVVLTRPTMTVHFDNRMDGRVVHNLGRYVGMQVYADGAEGQAFLDCHNIDENTCEADFNSTFSGYLLII